MCSLREKIIALAKENGADLVGFASAERFLSGAGRFDGEDTIFRILPETKTVIGLGFRILRGIYRGVEEGSTYYQYTTMAVENMEETVMPMAQLRVANLMEETGAIALPQRRHQQIMAETDGVNPEVAYNAIYRGRTAEVQMDFEKAAVLCGLGEIGLSGALLTDAFGPFVRYCFILTDAELEETPIPEPHLCDKCGKCLSACPGGCIDEKGVRDDWRCAVYYNGASGLTNPFMPPEGLDMFEDRIKIIAGEAQITPERARQILDELHFYPPAQHSYTCSICGRACDRACYVHLEETGKLTRKYKTAFRKRETWAYPVEDFEKKK